MRFFLGRLTLIPWLLGTAMALGCQPGAPAGRPLLLMTVPDAFQSFEVRDAAGEPIWRLEAEIDTILETVHYGYVPPGFRQVAPAEGGPRPLQVGEFLEIESRLRWRQFVHFAVADTENSVILRGHFTAPLESETPKQTEEPGSTGD